MGTHKGGRGQGPRGSYVGKSEGLSRSATVRFTVYLIDEVRWGIFDDYRFPTMRYG